MKKLKAIYDRLDVVQLDLKAVLDDIEDMLDAVSDSQHLCDEALTMDAIQDDVQSAADAASEALDFIGIAMSHFEGKTGV